MNLKHQSYLYFGLAVVTMIGYFVKEKPESIVVAAAFLIIGHIYLAATRLEQKKQL